MQKMYPIYQLGNFHKEKALKNMEDYMTKEDKQICFVHKRRLGETDMTLDAKTLEWFAIRCAVRFSDSGEVLYYDGEEAWEGRSTDEVG